MVAVRSIVPPLSLRACYLLSLLRPPDIVPSVGGFATSFGGYFFYREANGTPSNVKGEHVLTSFDLTTT